MRYFLTLLFVALLSACSGQQGEVVIRGHFDNLNQADFFVYSTDNQRSVIDTIHVFSGRFTYKCPVQSEATLHIVYPHMAEQIVFVRSGDVIDVEGDAANLREVSVTGNKDNKAYTRLRHTLNAAANDAERDSLTRAFISDNADSRVAFYLQQQLRMKAQEKPLLVKGAKLPKFQLIDREGMDTTVAEKKRAGRTLFNADTLTLDSVKGHTTLLVFWSHWIAGSNRVTRQVVEALRSNDTLQAITISADMRYSEYMWDLRSDSCFSDKYSKRWFAYCDHRGPQTGLFADWAVRNLPFYALVDRRGIITAVSRDYDKDIRPLIKK